MTTKSIALFRNGLGNFVLFTPALQAFASLDESGKVDLCLCSQWNDQRRQSLLDVAGNCPFIDRIVNYPAEKFDRDYKTWFWTAHTYPCPGLDWFRQKAPEFQSGTAWAHSMEHERDFYMKFMRRILGFKGETPKQFMPVADNPVIDKGGKPLIVFCNGSYGLIAASKKWHYFPELAKVVKRYFAAITAKIGYTDEKYGTELADTECDYDFVDNLSVLQTAKVIQQADLFVTVDTFSMHAGDALNAPMLAIWGGSLISKNAPVSPSAKVVKAEGIKCAPCHETGKYGDCIDYRCLASVTVNDVMAEARKKIL